MAKNVLYNKATWGLDIKSFPNETLKSKYTSKYFIAGGRRKQESTLFEPVCRALKGIMTKEISVSNYGGLYFAQRENPIEGNFTIAAYDTSVGAVFISDITEAGEISPHPDLMLEDGDGGSLGTIIHALIIAHEKEVDDEIRNCINIMDSKTTSADQKSNVLHIFCDNLYRRMQYPTEYVNGIEILNFVADGVYPMLDEPCLKVLDNTVENKLAEYLPAAAPIVGGKPAKKAKKKSAAAPSNSIDDAIKIIENYDLDELEDAVDTLLTADAGEVIPALKEIFSEDYGLTDEEKTLIPEWDKNWIISRALIDTLLNVKYVGRKTMLYGPAGTGKSTIARQMACVMGLPIEVFTCSAKTTEQDLIASFVPDTESNSDTPKFKIVDSAFIKAERPRIVECQEPSVMKDAGTLVALNRFLDDDGKMATCDGREISLNENSVIIMTTNVSYAGCRQMNNSVIDRMDTAIPLGAPSGDELAERALRKAALEDSERANIRKMAGYFEEIVEYCRENSICDEGSGDGVCGPRSFYNWVKLYKATGKVRETLKNTVLAKISLADTDAREEVWEACMLPKVPETF